MNIQRFLKKKPLFKDKKDGTDAYQAVYKQLCEKYFFHQDQAVRDRVESVCGINVFKEKNIFTPLQPQPYTKENHSLYLDFSVTDEMSRIIGFEDFKKVMKIGIHPFQFGNIEDNSKSKFNLKHLFLGILANSFVYGLTLYFEHDSCARNNLIDYFKIQDIPDIDTFFLKRFKEMPHHDCKTELNVTQNILKALLESRNSDYYILFFFMLYLWNRDSLVVDSFLPKSHIYNKQLFYPNFVGILSTRENGMIRTDYKIIVNNVEAELLSNWSNSFFKNLKEKNDSSNKYLKSSIMTIGGYANSGIRNILFDKIVNPFKGEWEKLINIKADAEKQKKYKMAINNTMDMMKRKDRWYYYYDSENFVFDDIRYIDKNPFLFFHGTSEHKVHNLRKADLDDIVRKAEYKLVCPMQFMQLSKETLQDIFSRVNVLVDDFHKYLINNMNDYLDNKLTKKLIDQINEKQKQKTDYRLDSYFISPLQRRDFKAWQKVAADYINKNIKNQYEKYDGVLDYTDIYSEINNAIRSLKNQNRAIEKDAILEVIKSAIDLTNEHKASKMQACYNILCAFDKEDPFFDNIDSERQMISYCKSMKRDKACISFEITLFMWWICGYIDYLKNGLFLQKDNNTSSKYHYRIKRISLNRLHAFQKRTCEFAIRFAQDNDEPPKGESKPYSDDEKLQLLISEYESKEFYLLNNECTNEHCNPCWKQIEKITKRLQHVKCFSHNGHISRIE